MFQIVINEIASPNPDAVPGSSGQSVVERFRQTVDTLDVSRIVAMINTKPRARRNSKTKEGKA